MTTLTQRQQEIAALIAKGCTHREIAEQLGVSPNTVNAHVQEAARRLGGETSPRHRLTVWFYSVTA